LIIACQSPSKPLFEKKSATQTGISFSNEIEENETHNILNFTNLYTGSGVGIGDFNQDGLPDVFLGGNMESSHLYLNKGNFEFEDITAPAGIATDRWVTGVAVIDINEDGYDDLYLSVSGNNTAEKKKNLLFINEQDNTFIEKAEAYGIADSIQSTHASFFDYDKDGDLDLYLIVNPTNYNLFNVNNIRKKKINGEAASTDKLYRNNGDQTFTDVSKEAGILVEGYSLGLNTSDLTGDGWPDVYVTNDFMTNDLLYVNNQDGTFTNKAAEMLKHSSFASMGIDVSDINNDGEPDIFVLDMFPEDNLRQKMIMGSDNYKRFQYMLQTGYEPQYSRNTLQRNNGNGTYSEIGQMANVHQTDWSWSALLEDYDNDGLRDLFVTNGFKRDLGDLDYINYTNTNPFGNADMRKIDQLKRINEQPKANMSNYIFKNDNGWSFSKKTKEWGIEEPSCSHGAAFADLDLDGDLDLITNNVSQMAFVYENKISEQEGNNYLNFKLKNKNELGTQISIYVKGEIQYAAFNPYRGYQSTVENLVHFGLGKIETVDSIIVQWNDQTISKMVKVESNQTIVIEKPLKDVALQVQTPKTKNLSQTQLKQSNQTIPYIHKEDLQVDFYTQTLLPHQHSTIGPALAVSDVNGDGLQDLFVGGAAGIEGQFFIQKEDGTFVAEIFGNNKQSETVSCLFFDADRDGDDDLYMVNGGVIGMQADSIYQDRLYYNTDGRFEQQPNALPTMWASGGCVTANDFDKDGDLDLFVGGRVTPNKYPTIPNSFLLENVGGTFKDSTPQFLSKIGMVTDATWADVDKDGDDDLVLLGEFMPITVVENEAGVLNKMTTIANSKGWWNAIEAIDFDNDGDLDFMTGNLGLNSTFKASPEHPVCLYANDFDKNGSIDPVLCHFIEGKEYPVPSRDKLVQQIPPIKGRFTNYKKYAEATFKDLFKRPEEKGMQVLEAQIFESCFIENKGNGIFDIRPLPNELQTAPINDFLLEDINNDGLLDVMVVGNSYAAEVGQGRYDAFIGAIILSNKTGAFNVIDGHNSGFYCDKEAKSIVKLKNNNRANLYIVGNNSDSLQVFIK